MAAENLREANEAQTHDHLPPKMSCSQFILFRFDCLMINVGTFIHKNICTIIAWTVAGVALAYIEASTDTFERIAAFAQQKEPVLSEPPKDVSLAQFLGLDDLFEFVRNNLIVSAVAAVLFVVFIYYESQPPKILAKQLAVEAEEPQPSPATTTETQLEDIKGPEIVVEDVDIKKPDDIGKETLRKIATVALGFVPTPQRQRKRKSEHKEVDTK